MDDLIRRYRDTSTSLLELWLNRNMLKTDNEILAAIQVLKQRGIDVSKWFDDDDQSDIDDKLLATASKIFSSMLAGRYDENVRKVIDLVNGRDLDQLPSHELEEIIYISKQKPAGNMPVIKHEQATMSDLFPKSKRGPQPGKDPNAWKRAPKAKRVIECLNKGMSCKEIFKLRFTSYYYIRAIIIRLENESAKK